MRRLGITFRPFRAAMLAAGCLYALLGLLERGIGPMLVSGRPAPLALQADAGRVA